MHTVARPGARPGLRSAAAVAGAVARLGAAWAVAILGPIGSVREWGPLIVYQPVADVGVARIQVLVAASVLVAAVAARWAPVAVLPLQAGFVVVLALATADNVGRLQGAVAGAIAIAAVAALVAWHPLPRWPARPRSVVPVAVLPLVGSSLAWAYLGSVPITGAGVVATLGIVELRHRRPTPFDHLDDLLGRRAPAAARRGAERGAAWAGRALAGGRARAASGLATLRTWIAHRHPERIVTTELGRVVLGGAAAGLIFAPVLWRLVAPADPLVTVVGINDYGPHLTAAENLRLVPLHLEIAHFGFHLASATAALVLGWTAGPVLVLSISVGATFVVAQRLLRAPDRSGSRLGAAAAAAGAAFFLLAETPTLGLLHLGWIRASTRFETVHALYSPTWVVLLPFALGALLVVERVVAAPDEAPARRRLVGLSALVVLGTLAKPSFTLCLLPGLAAYLLLVERRGWRRDLRILAWVGAPAVAVLAWQSWFLNHAGTEIGGGGVTFDPIGGPPYGWSQARWAFWLPLLWPLAAIAATRGAFVRDRLVQVVAASLVFAMGLFLLFRETGPREGHGNLGVSPQVCATVLVLLSIRALARTVVELRREPAGWGRTVRLGAVAALTSAFAWGGLVSYLDAMDLLHVPIDWGSYIDAAASVPWTR